MPPKAELSHPLTTFLGFKARRYLGTDTLARTIHSHPETLQERLTLFDDAIKTLNRVRMKNPDPYFYPDVAALNLEMAPYFSPREPFPPLDDLAYAPAEAGLWRGADIPRLVTETFIELNMRVDDIIPQGMEKDPYRVAFALLRVGYPLLVAKIYGKTPDEQQRIAHHVGKAIGNIIEQNFSSSELEGDLKLWRRQTGTHMLIPKAQEFFFERTFLEKINFYNEFFTKGGEAHEIATLLRSTQLPIVLWDLHGVLISHKRPFRPNPESEYALGQTIPRATNIVVSGSETVANIKEALVEAGLFHPLLVLMARPNFRSMTGEGRKNPTVRKIIKEYNQKAREQGIYYRESDFFQPMHRKAIAPLFGQPILKIPLFDDFRGATENNPGIFGIRVRHWDTAINPPSYDSSVKGWSVREGTDFLLQTYL